MRKRIEWEWEKLDTNTFRAKVIGGWIIRCIGGFLRNEVVSVKEAKNLSMSESMTFIPDRDHEWHILPKLIDELENGIINQINKSADFDPKK